MLQQRHANLICGQISCGRGVEVDECKGCVYPRNSLTSARKLPFLDGPCYYTNGLGYPPAKWSTGPPTSPVRSPLDHRWQEGRRESFRDQHWWGRQTYGEWVI